MEPIMLELADRLAEMHNFIERAIADLPDEALVWSPGRDMNTLAVLVVHTLGAERYWIGDVAGEEPSGRVRAAEFETPGISAAELLERARETLAHSRSVLNRLTASDFEVVREVGEDSRRLTVAWAVLHALEHTALHVGHIQLTRQLWDQSVE